MKIRFLQDYQGYLTPGHFYHAGQVYDLPAQQVEALVAAGRGELVNEPRPEPVSEPAQVDYDDMTVAELRDIARERDISYFGLRKADLIEALRNG